MNEYKELAIQALNNAKGDDLYRAKMQFTGLSDVEMSQFHGQSGKTRREILDGYVQYESKINRAIDWVTKQ